MVTPQNVRGGLQVAIAGHEAAPRKERALSKFDITFLSSSILPPVKRTTNNH